LSRLNAKHSQPISKTALKAGWKPRYSRPVLIPMSSVAKMPTPATIQHAV
jgi:hypothetical protein